MNAPIQTGASFSDALKARRAHSADLLTLLDVKQRKATEIENLTINTIKIMINTLDGQLKKRD